MPDGDPSALTAPPHDGPAGLNRAAAILGSLVLGIVALVLYQSAFWLDSTSPAVKIGLALFGALAIARPSQALLVVAGVTPLSAVIWPSLGLTPARGAEALVLALIAGWYLRGGGARQGACDALVARVSLLFGLVVVAAWLEIFTPLALTWTGPQTRTTGLVQLFTTRFLEASIPDTLAVCALLVTSTALAYATSGMSRRDPELPPRIVRMMLAGGLGAAALSLFRVAAGLARSDDPVELLRRVASGEIRLSMHVPDVNAAGSFFVLVALLALGRAATARRAWPAAAASAVAVVALFISGSRAALFAGIAVTIGGLAVLAWRRFVSLARPATVLSGLALSLAVVVIAIVQPDAGRSTVSSLRIRYYFTETSARMIASSPIFGVGLNRYVARSPQYMPRELRRLYPRENAHNYFLQVTAELGMIGGVLFGLLMVIPIVRGVRTLAGRNADPALVGVTGGLAAFAITCLSGHPLLFAQVAYPFWILVGLASGLVLRSRDTVAATIGVAAAPSRLAPVATWAAATLGVLLVISIPVRVQTASRNTSFARVDFGFHEWEVDPRGRRFRWTAGSATFYVPTGVRTIDIPVRAWNATREQPTSVTIDVNGRTARAVTLDHSGWTSVRLELPPRAPDRVWRIDLHVAPVSRPARVDPRLTDDRLLGVRVGELQLTPDPDTRAPENRSVR